MVVKGIVLQQKSEQCGKWVNYFAKKPVSKKKKIVLIFSPEISPTVFHGTYFQKSRHGIIAWNVKRYSQICLPHLIPFLKNLLSFIFCKDACGPEISLPVLGKKMPLKFKYFCDSYRNSKKERLQTNLQLLCRPTFLKLKPESHGASLFGCLYVNYLKIPLKCTIPKWIMYFINNSII